MEGSEIWGQVLEGILRPTSALPLSSLGEHEVSTSSTTHFSEELPHCGLQTMGSHDHGLNPP